MATSSSGSRCSRRTLYELAPTKEQASDIQTYAPARRLFEDQTAGAVDFLADLVATAIEEGRVRTVDPRVAAEVLFAATIQVVGRELERPGEANRPDTLMMAIDVVLVGLVEPTVATSTPCRNAGPEAKSQPHAEKLSSVMGYRVHHSARQEEILDALEDFFLERGFQNVTIGDVVRRAECSRASSL